MIDKPTDPPARNPHTRTSIFHLLLELERKHGLCEHRTSQGVCFWKLIRFSLFETILNQLGIAESRNKEGMAGRSMKTSAFRETLHSALLFFRRVDAVILEFPRKVPTSSGYIDPYSKPVVDELEKTGKSYLLVEEGTFGHLDPSHRRRRYVGGSIFERYIRLTIRKRGDPLDPASQSKLNAVLSELSAHLGVSVEYEKTRARIRRFELQRRLWKTIIRHTGCKDVYLVCSYGNEGVIAAAREAGVRVTELQHGLILKHHPGYSFGRREVPYFPDRLFVFGRKWCGPFLPLEENACRVIGYSYLNEQIRERGVPSSRERIVFLSQWSNNGQMLEYAGNLHQARPGLPIVFKFHPRDNDAVVEEARRTIPGITFVKGEKQLYEILGESRFALGVFSTSILEALAFGCRVALIAAPGIEVMEDLIADLRLPVVSCAEEIAAWLESEDAGRGEPMAIEDWFHGCRSQSPPDRIV